MKKSNPKRAGAWLINSVFWLGAVVVGLVIVAMTFLSEWATQKYHTLSADYFGYQFLAPPIGLAVIAWLTFRFFPGSERSGIPQIKSVLESDDPGIESAKLLSFKISLGKLFLPLMGLLSGASVGLGGPVVHIGASILYSLGKVTKFPAHYLTRGLILAGSAAGFAALFNAPLAGIIFALEEMGRTLDEKISGLMITAIVISGITAYAFLNYRIYFVEELISMPLGATWLAIPVCATVGGIAGGIFSKVAITGSHLISRSKISFFTIAFVCGGVIAVINFYSQGATAGTGYHQAKAIFNDADNMEITYPLYKMISTWATFFSGIPSGIFVPSLATGAGIGADVAHWLPVAPSTVMILLTMTAYFSAMLQTPLTAFVVVMEVTDSHEILIPLMAASYMASWISKIIHPVPLYRALCDAYTQK
ncbi:hypothetical protein MCAMS1_00115 [biofilm metagenome]